MTSSAPVTVPGTASAEGQVPADPDKYRAPDGFFGHPWGAPFVDFDGLKLLPGGVALAAGYQGKVMDIRIQNCEPVAEGGTPAGPCRIDQDVRGAGSYVLASYYRDAEPLQPYADADVAVAVYYFCARTSGDFVSRHVRKRLKLCGGDAVFFSDAPAIWREGDPVTNYARVVKALTARHGRPDDFNYSGYVTVEDEFGETTPARERSYGPLFWCRKMQRALDPSCQATLTLD
ncbi:MAG: hypothetical protein AAFX58_09190, partial [Pseudomonadota bacterium]